MPPLLRDVGRPGHGGRLLNAITGLVCREMARTEEKARILKRAAREIAALEDARA